MTCDRGCLEKKWSVEVKDISMARSQGYIDGSVQLFGWAGLGLTFDSASISPVVRAKSKMSRFSFMWSAFQDRGLIGMSCCHPQRRRTWAKVNNLHDKFATLLSSHVFFSHRVNSDTKKFLQKSSYVVSSQATSVFRPSVPTHVLLTHFSGGRPLLPSSSGYLSLFSTPWLLPFFFNCKTNNNKNFVWVTPTINNIGNSYFFRMVR